MDNFQGMLSEILQKENACLMEEPMSRHTTFRVGGPAQYFVTVSDTAELKKVLFCCKEAGLPVTVLGNGSNVLVSDQGLRGVVLHPAGEFSACVLTGEEKTGLLTVTAGAGRMLSSFAMEVAKAGYAGAEFAAGIPGTIGGAILMNAGAYGGEIKDCIKEAVWISMDGEERVFSREDMQFSYRHSIFSEKEGMILFARFAFTKGNKEEILSTIEELNRRRREKQPLEYPSAGSTFKRPEGYFAGKLIQDCNLAGFHIGGAQVSEKHCGFIINRGGATAKDIYDLIMEVSDRVEKQFCVRLEPEVRLLGEF